MFHTFPECASLLFANCKDCTNISALARAHLRERLALSTILHLSLVLYKNSVKWVLTYMSAAHGARVAPTFSPVQKGIYVQSLPAGRPDERYLPYCTKNKIARPAPGRPAPGRPAPGRPAPGRQAHGRKINNPTASRVTIALLLVGLKLGGGGARALRRPCRSG